MQNHRVDDWTVGEADPVVVCGFSSVFPTLSMSSAVATRWTPRASGMSSTSKLLLWTAQLLGHGFS